MQVKADIKNLSIGSIYTLSPSPNYIHTANDGGLNQLTDGKYTIGLFWKSRSSVGWVESGIIEININLKEHAYVQKICINTARGEFAEVNYPESISVFLTSNDEYYSYYGDVMSNENNNVGGYSVRKFCIEKNHSYLYSAKEIHLIIVPKGKYTFIDEIEISGDTDFYKKDNATLQGKLKKQELQQFVKARLYRKRKLTASIKQAIHFLHKLELENNLINHNELDKAIRIISDLSRNNDPALQDNDIDKIVYGINNQYINSINSGDLVTWQVDPWVNFTKYSVPTPKKILKDNDVINIDTINHLDDVVSIGVMNTTSEIKKINIYIENIDKYKSQNVTWSEVVPALAYNNEWINDALVVNNTIILDPYESKQIWFSISANDLKPGAHLSKCRIKESIHGNTLKTITLKINSLGELNKSVVVPYVNTWSYLNDRLIMNISDAAVMDLNDHKVNVFVIHPSEIPWSNPILTKNSIDVNHENFNKRIRQIHNSNMILLFLYFNNKKFCELNLGYKFNSEEWRVEYKKLIQSIDNDFKNMNIDTSNYAFYPVDEPVDENDIHYLEIASKLIKEVNPKIQVYTTLDGRFDVNQLSRLLPTVDIFQLNAYTIKTDNILKLKHDMNGKMTWIYTTYSGKIVDPNYYRRQAWDAFIGDYGGFGFWAYSDIGSVGSAWDDFDGRRPDYAVIYSIDNTIVSSKRWEGWRVGVEEYSLLQQYAKKTSIDKAHWIAKQALQYKDIGEGMTKIRNQIIHEIELLP